MGRHTITVIYDKSIEKSRPIFEAETNGLAYFSILGECNGRKVKSISFLNSFDGSAIEPDQLQKQEVAEGRQIVLTFIMPDVPLTVKVEHE